MTDTTLSAPIGPRRVRRWLIVLVVILMPFAVHAIWDQVESMMLARDVAAIAQRGEPVNVVSRREPLRDPELRRSAALYAAAAKLARWQNGGFGFDNSDIEDHSSGALFAGAKLQAYLAESEPALQLLNTATPLRFERFGDVATEFSGNQSPLESLNAMNCLSADILSARGEGDVAADVLIRSIRLQRTITISFYRNFSLRRLYGSLHLLLLHGQPGPDSLRRLQAAIEEWPDDDGLAAEVLNARAEMLDEFWPHPPERNSWVLRAQPMLRSRAMMTAAFVVFRPLMTHAIRRELGPFQEVLDVARQPWPGKQDAAQALVQKYAAEMKRASQWRITTGWLTLPPAMALFDLAELPWAGANLAMRRTAIVVVAAERYRRDHGGAPPPSLQALVPQYLAAVPEDPFSGRPPVLKIGAADYVVYSVDIDRKDDGGVLYGIGTGVKERWRNSDTQTPRDLGIRVPLTPQH
jgi:hypothetical protein